MSVFLPRINNTLSDW